jgi:hypothetical protein
LNFGRSGFDHALQLTMFTILTTPKRQNQIRSNNRRRTRSCSMRCNISSCCCTIFLRSSAEISRLSVSALHTSRVRKIKITSNSLNDVLALANHATQDTNTVSHAAAL